MKDRATIKPGYTLPKRECCGQKMRPVALLDYECAQLYLQCIAGGNCPTVEVEWPFREKQACWDDYQRVGFVCIDADDAEVPW